MSNSTSNIDNISSGQAQKEVTANAFFDAASQGAIFGRRASTTGGLTWGYYGGRFTKSDGTNIAIANGTLTLTASNTNYIEVDSSGTIHQSTSGFTAGRIQLYTIVAGASTITSYTDNRDGSQGNFLASAGSIIGQPVDFMAFYPGIPTASAIVTRVPVARIITFPASLTGSYAKASASATATTNFDLQKNGSSVGTISFAAGASTATFTAASPIVTAAGDVISIIAPATPDATLANIGFVLTGTR